MADNSFITQCPHCNTSFRVRNEQLAIANGSVRCGACLQVFSARNHIMKSTQPEPPKPVAKRPAPKQAAPAKPKPVVKKPAAPKKPPVDEFNFAADEDDDAEFLFMDSGEDDDYEFSDSPGDSLFDEKGKNDGFGELSDSFLNLGNSESNPNETSHFQKEALEMEKDTLEDEETPDESWAESMLDEIEKEDRISIQKSKPAVFEAREVGSKPDISAPKDFNTQANSVFDFSETTSTSSAAFTPSASQIVKNASNASREIDLDFGETERLQRLRSLGWLIVVLLLVAVAGQFAWSQRDTYARMDQWRGLYQYACNIFNCTLPAQEDVSAIRTSILVREHKDPSLKDLRIVDIVLTNKAPFKQPFPDLLLQYTDINNKLIADQLVAPNTYLKGEMTGETLMPINTRIYISFPIKAPPRNAVNHQLLLL